MAQLNLDEKYRTITNEILDAAESHKIDIGRMVDVHKALSDLQEFTNKELDKQRKASVLHELPHRINQLNEENLWSRVANIVMQNVVIGSSDETQDEHEEQMTVLLESYKKARDVVSSNQDLEKLFSQKYIEFCNVCLARLNYAPKSILQKLTEKAEETAEKVRNFDYDKYDEHMRMAGAALIASSERRFQTPGSYFGSVDKDIRKMADEVYFEQKSSLDLDQIAEVVFNLGLATCSSLAFAVICATLGLDGLVGLGCIAAVGSAAGCLLATGVIFGQVIAGIMLYSVSYGLQGLDMAMPYIDYAACQSLGRILKAMGEHLQQPETSVQDEQTTDEIIDAPDRVLKGDKGEVESPHYSFSASN